MIIFGRTPSPAMNSYENLQVSVTNQYIAISSLTTHLISRLVFNTINFKPFFPGRAGPSHFYYIIFKHLRKYNKVYIHFSYITPQQSLDRRVKTEEKSGSERCLSLHYTAAMFLVWFATGAGLCCACSETQTTLQTLSLAFSFYPSPIWRLYEMNPACYPCLAKRVMMISAC